MKVRIPILLACIGFALDIQTQSDLQSLQRIVDHQYHDVDIHQRWDIDLKGILDDRLAIDVFLKTDQHQYYGAIKRERSGHRWLEGEAGEDGQVTLFEFDLNERMTGVITGYFNGGSFYGTWRDIRMNVEYPMLALSAEDAAAKKPALCVATYASDIKKMCIVQTNEETRVVNTASDTGSSHIAECLAEDCSVLRFEDSLGVEQKISLGDKNARLMMSGRAETAQYFELTNRLDFEYFSKKQGLAVIYQLTPLFNKAGLNETWADQMAVLLGRESAVPVNKEEPEVTVDFIFDYLDHRYLAGILTIQNTWDAGMRMYPLILDMKKNRWADVRDLTPKNFGNYFEEYLKQTDTEQRLKHVSPGFTGVMLRSEFHPIFGTKTVELPYTQIPFKLFD